MSSIRNIEKALGDGIKKPTKSEEKNIIVARKSIVASKYIKEGELYTNENLSIKRPGSGLPPTMLNVIIGTKSNRQYKPNDLIKLN